MKGSIWKALLWLLLGLAIGFVIGRLSPVLATAPEWKDITECSAPCGTTEGTKTQERVTVEYKDPICPEWYHVQNSGNWNQRCHRDFHWMHPEHKAPIGCPKDYSQSGANCVKETRETREVKCEAKLIECPPQCDLLTYTCEQCGEKPNDEYCGEWKHDWCVKNMDCEYDDDKWNCGCDDPTPTPTPTPTPSPIPTEEPKRGTTEASAPQCTNTRPVLLPANPLVWRLGGNAIVQWQPTEGDRANIYYQEVGKPANAHAVRDTENDGYVEIGMLGNLDWTFGIQQAHGCAGGDIIWVADGATNGWVLFRP